jgi:hypothetical protein
VETLAAFLKAIPSAAASPLALVAYLVIVIAWVVLSYRKGLIGAVGPHLQNVPKNKRAELLKAVLPGGDTPVGYTAEHYNANRNADRKLYAFYAVLATIVIVLAIAGYKAHNELDRSDGMIGEILDNPQTIRTALANLERGPDLVAGAEEDRPGDIPQDISANDLGEMIDRMRMGNSGMNNSEAIMRQLRDRSKGGRLLKASRISNEAVRQLDEKFEKLDNCYRETACANGKRAAELCRLTARILQDVGNVNGSTGGGVTVDTTDAASNFGNGAMDPYFHALSTPHIRSLHSQACT